MDMQELRAMTPEQIAEKMRTAWAAQQTRGGISYEFGCELVNIVAQHGNKIADALNKST